MEFKMKKIEKYDIFVIIICAIIFAYSIFIGSPLKNNTNIINLVTLIIFVIYIISTIITNKKYKIIKNKIDIFVIILTFSSYIALIFQNYSNLEATIEYIIKYTTILALYIMVRDIVLRDKKYINYIITVIMFSSITIFIFGLDNITNNFLDDFLKNTGNVEVLNPDKRFNSIFGYANTTATLMVAISILAIGKYLNTQKKLEKIFCNSIIFLNLVAVIISYSRATWIISAIIYILYIFILRDQKSTILELLIRTRNFKWNIQYNCNKINKSK